MDNDIIRSQVDGRPEWKPHDFNEQNRTWAANLANVALADPQNLSVSLLHLAWSPGVSDLRS
jgi:hypothetical protein